MERTVAVTRLPFRFGRRISLRRHFNGRHREEGVAEKMIMICPVCPTGTHRGGQYGRGSGLRPSVNRQV